MCVTPTMASGAFFENQILRPGESLSQASGRTLIAGDFNSKSLEWGEARLNRRMLIRKMVSRNEITVLN